MAKDVFLVLSGGPGIFNPRDEGHDESWDNFVTPLLLRSKLGTLPLDTTREELHWLVYEPAYMDRWYKDVNSSRELPTQHGHTRTVLGRGFKDYLDLLKRRAREHGWIYEGLYLAEGFWKYLQWLGRRGRRVSQFWYYGHARDDLWLSVDHDQSHETVAPGEEAIIQVAHIKTQANPFSFVQRDKTRPHKLFGCNTVAFAEAMAKHLKVYAEGCEDTLLYTSLWSDNGMLRLASGAKWYQFTYNGMRKLLLAKPSDVVR